MYENVIIESAAGACVKKKPGWSNRDYLIEVLNWMSGIKTCSLLERMDYDYSSIRSLVTNLFDFGYITRKEMDRLVCYFDDLIQKKQQKKERDAL